MCLALAEAENVAGYDHALDLRGALADLGQLRVAENALDGKLGDIAGAAMDLQRLGRRLHGDLGGKELGHGGGRLRGPSRVLEGRGAEREESRGLDVGPDVRDHALQPVELGQRPAEGPPLLHVAERLVERGLRDADAHGGHGDAAALEHLQRVDEAHVGLAQQVGAGDGDVVEDQLGGVGGVKPELAGTARDCIAAASEPDPDSVSPQAPRASPRASRGRYAAFCSFEPKSAMWLVQRELWAHIVMPTEASTRLSSSTASAYET